MSAQIHEADRRLSISPPCDKLLPREFAHVDGARPLTSDDRHEAGRLFFQPTVLADPPADTAIMSEKTFGPVAAIASFSAEGEAVARAKATEYGLLACLYTGGPGRIARMTRGLEYGMAAVNRSRITGARSRSAARSNPALAARARATG